MHRSYRATHQTIKQICGNRLRPYRKILVPYDGTISTEQTLKTACRIARWNDSQVLVAVPFFTEDNREGGFKDRIQSGVSLISRQEEVHMETFFQDGRPSEMIIDVSQQQGNDLIVLGKAEMNALEKFVVGTILGRIIGEATCDIMVVPEDAPVRWWNNILLCTDGSRYSRAATENAIAYARHFAGTIKAISIVDLTDEFYAQAPDRAHQMVEKAGDALDEVAAQARECGVRFSSIIKEGNVVEKILEVAAESKASIIMMGSHERSGLGRLLMGSVSRKVAMNAFCPAFIIKP